MGLTARGPTERCWEVGGLCAPPGPGHVGGRSLCCAVGLEELCSPWRGTPPGSGWR